MMTYDDALITLVSEKVTEYPLESLIQDEVRIIAVKRGLNKRETNRLEALQLFVRTYLKPSKQGQIISNSRDIFEMFRFLGTKPKEEFWLVTLNRKNKVINSYQMSTGSINGTIVSVTDIAKSAILDMASGVILIHNHPSNNIKPSQADIDLTRKCKSAMEFLDMPVLDHIIVTKDGYYSFADEGHMR